MTTHAISCPDCGIEMQPIKLIDATEPGWSRKGAVHTDLAYAASDAHASLFLGNIPKLGTVRGVICPRCGQIKLFGQKCATE